MTRRNSPKPSPGSSACEPLATSALSLSLYLYLCMCYVYMWFPPKLFASKLQTSCVLISKYLAVFSLRTRDGHSTVGKRKRLFSERRVTSELPSAVAWWAHSV